jgi:enamine deaminase RidA (YjgF/YER057c/UK114 family)
MTRRFVPFGRDWRMGIEVPYSLAVLDHGCLWSCGQCPLDRDARVLFPGKLRNQLELIAGRIGDELARCGLAPDRLGKLVAYAATDAATPLDAVEPVLRKSLKPVPLVLTIGVPQFYYPGMMVEIDVHGATDGLPTAETHRPHHGAQASVVAFGGIVHLRLVLDPGADLSRLRGLVQDLLKGFEASLDAVVSAHLFLAADAAATARTETAAAVLGADPGAAVLAMLPHGAAAIVDIIAEAGATGSTSLVVSNGVSLVERRAGKALGLAARWTGPQQPPAAATRCIMEVLSHRLAAHGFRFADVVKQQTYYVGAASEKDLHANMTIRNAYYARPGPASTGLAVHGFLDPNCRITVEVLASRRS